MKRFAALVALASIAACSEGGDPVQMALRDASAERQAAAVRDGAISTRPEPGSAAATGASEADAAFVAGMIEHHRAAMAMAVDALARSEDPELRQLAQAEIDTRSRQLAELQAWTPVGQASAPGQ
jgi:uncharacterized protein (DUF305 family)